MLIGGAIPWLFSCLAINAVSRAASLIVNEVRRQFKIPGLMEGKVKPDYGQAVGICTVAAQKELTGLSRNPEALAGSCIPSKTHAAGFYPWDFF